MHFPSITLRRTRIAEVTLAVSLLLTACSEAPVTLEPSTTPTPTRAPATHVVLRGESLSQIARSTGVAVATLAELNGIRNPDVIEPGMVLLLEPPPPAPIAAPQAAAPESTDPVLTWLGDRWDDLQPHLTLSERSIEEGAIAGLLLPASVGALVVVWLLIEAVRTAVFAMAGPLRRRDSRTEAAATPGATEAATSPPRPSRRLRPSSGNVKVRRPSLRPVATAGATFTGWAHAHLEGLMRSLARQAADTSSALRERMQQSRATRTERRHREEEHVRQAALRARCWRPGMEALRIGLLDEAARSFEAGLEAARGEGWLEEIALFETSLERVRERTSAVAVSPQA